MKHFKMLLYGEPGVGKSVFACKMPKPFFITTDGNYEWLEDFGADPNAHIRVSSWNEAKDAFDNNFDGYETVVVDLVEDLFKWCEYEFCKQEKLRHISELPWSQGYDITRNDFFITLCKLINLDKNVILLSHGQTVVYKDRAGREHTSFRPSNRIPDKVLDMIEGRMRYVLRCYLESEQVEDTTYKRRKLSLVPKENEWGILRGIDENKVPQDIALDTNLFLDIIGYNKKSNVKPDIKVEQPKTEEKATEQHVEEQIAEAPKVEEPTEAMAKAEVAPHVVEEAKPEVKEEVKEEPKTEEVATPKAESPAEKLARIKAQLAAKKANK